MFKAIALTTALLAPIAASAQPAASAPALPPAPADWRPLDPANTQVIETTKGRIVIEMRPEIAPTHVGRIKALARSGYYNGAQFYRVLEFMAQTGDKGAKTFRSELPNMKNEFAFRLAPTTPYASFGPSPAGDLGFVGSMPVVIAPDPARPAGQAPTGGLGSAMFCVGTAAFAHGQAPDSANSQFFLMRIPGHHLEHQFSAWGRVLQGQEAVAALNNGEPPPVPDKMTRVRVMADMPAAERPALQVMDTRSPGFAALVQQAFATKGVAFTLCDVPVPVKAG